MSACRLYFYNSYHCCGHSSCASACRNIAASASRELRHRLVRVPYVLVAQWLTTGIRRLMPVVTPTKSGHNARQWCGHTCVVWPINLGIRKRKHVDPPTQATKQTTRLTLPTQDAKVIRQPPPKRRKTRDMGRS